MGVMIRDDFVKAAIVVQQINLEIIIRTTIAGACNLHRRNVADRVRKRVMIKMAVFKQLRNEAKEKYQKTYVGRHMMSQKCTYVAILPFYYYLVYTRLLVIYYRVYSFLLYVLQYFSRLPDRITILLYRKIFV